MKQTKRWLAGLLCAVLLAGLLPTAAFAATADWATPAVTALNSIYGVNAFSADDGTMTVGDAYTVLSAMGCAADGITENSTDTFTRSAACTVLADIFDLPANGSAIQYLYNQNIINGRGPNDLAAEDAITKAEFAVITYRVLNSVGGGLGSATVLKPGTKEYFALLYLSYRASALSGQDLNTLNTAMNSVTNIYTQKYDITSSSAHQWGYTPLGGQELWNAWAIRLNYLKSNSDTNNTTIDGAAYNESDTLINAAVKMVDAYIAAGGSDTIFSDVRPGNWYYDGVVYLADRGIVTGFGDGLFGPEVTSDPATVLTRAILAVLLFRADQQPVQSDWLGEAKAYAANKGYMTPDSNVSNWWDSSPTREETIVAIMKQQKVDTSSVNTDILDRFSDAGSISASARPYVAYAVSLGIVNGDASNNLNPTAQPDRGTAGVLLYRTLLGADKTKMKDYADDVSYATGAAQVQTFALFAAPAVQADTQLTLELREDWRLTSDLNLNVPEGATLTINGNGHHIYEMGGKLTNSGTGVVTFQNTALYPAVGDAAGVTSDGTWDDGESNQLMLERQPHIITVNSGEHGTVTGAAAAKKGDTVTLTVTPESGYELDTLTVTATEGSGETVSESNYSFTMPASDVTVEATFKEAGAVTPTSYTVTVQNDGNGTASASPASAAQGTEITLTAAANSGYHFKEWQVVSGGVTVIGDKFTMPEGNVTVKAVFEQDSGGSSSGGSSSSGGGSSSGGSSSSSNTTTTTEHNPDGSTTTTVTNRTTGTVTETTRNPDGSQTVVETKKDGTVTTTETDKAGNRSETVAKPDGSSETRVNNQDGSTSTTKVDTDGQVKAEITLTEKTVEATQGEPVALPIPQVPVSTNWETASTVAVRLPKDSKNVKVEIPVKDVTPGTVAVMVNADGSETVVKTSLTTEGGVTVTVSDGATVKIVDNSKQFSDIPEDHWASGAVDFASSRELLNGTSAAEATFSPEADMTRAMLMTVLARFDGADTEGGSVWYEKAMEWAKASGVSDGTAPNSSITREQMVTMLYRYAGSPAVTGSLDGFADADKVSGYALDAMRWAVDTGIMGGMGDGTLSPGGKATRAQVATIMMRYVQNLTR